MESRRVVIANWKMNPETISEATKLFKGIVKESVGLKKVETVVCPSFVYLSELRKLYRGKQVLLGAQNLFPEPKGSHTGEVSPTQLNNFNLTHVILGHSERRAGGETDIAVNRKIKSALKYRLKPIVCVGERARDTHGRYLQFVHDQLRTALEGVSAKDVPQKIVIAYEPIWAIGKTGDEAITPQKLHEMILYIRKVLISLYNKKVGLTTTVVYGGSVEPKNAKELLVEGAAQGFLVGHASLNAQDFGQILHIANTATYEKDV